MISIVLAVILVAGILYWMFKAERKESHHLDGLHISPGDKEKK